MEPRKIHRWEINEDALERAHAHCGNNRPEIELSRACGCFYCLAVFKPAEIVDWIDEHADTALCPRCGVDSVLADASQFPLSPEFLGAMRAKWFD